MGLAIRRMLHFVSNDVDIGVAKERGKDGECASQGTRSETTRFSWLINLLERAGAPPSVKHTLTPLTIATCILIELANVAAAAAHTYGSCSWLNTWT